MDDFPMNRERTDSAAEYSAAPEIGTTADESQKEYEYVTSPEDSLPRKKSGRARSLLIQAAGLMLGGVLMLNSFNVDPLAINALFSGASSAPVSPGGVSTTDSFPMLPNQDPDFAGNYAWAGMGSEEYLVLDSVYLHAGTYYTSNGVTPKSLGGASYDKTTNTLTLKNYHGTFIDANLMGNGFKIRLVGDNSLDSVKIWGAMYGGSLTFTGDGSIVINQNKTNDSGIFMECESSASALMIDRNATVEVFGKQAIVIHATQMKTAVYALNPIQILGGTVGDGTFVVYQVNATDAAGNLIYDENGNPVIREMTVKDIGQNQGIDLYDDSVVDPDGNPSEHVTFQPYKP